MTEAQRAEEFAKKVFGEMAKLRGWTNNIPSEVQDDIFATMGRWDNFYSDAFAKKADPERVARRITYMEWDCPNNGYGNWE